MIFIVSILLRLIGIGPPYDMPGVSGQPDMGIRQTYCEDIILVWNERLYWTNIYLAKGNYLSLEAKQLSWMQQMILGS